MFLCYLIFILVLHNELRFAQKLDKPKTKETVHKAKCKNIKCPPIEDPVCVKIKNEKNNKIAFIVAINKCEIQYAKCRQGFDAVVVPMENCQHDLGNSRRKNSKRNKRETQADAKFAEDEKDNGTANLNQDGDAKFADDEKDNSTANLNQDGDGEQANDEGAVEEDNEGAVEGDNEEAVQEGNDEETQEDNDEAVQEDNEEAVQEDNEEALQEDNEEAVQDDNDEAVQEDNEEAVQEDNEEALQEDNEEAVQEDSEEALQEDNEEAVQEDSEEAFQEDNEEALQEDNEEAVQEDSEEALQEDNEEAAEDDNEKTVEDNNEYSDEEDKVDYEQEDETQQGNSDDKGDKLSNQYDVNIYNEDRDNESERSKDISNLAPDYDQETQDVDYDQNEKHCPSVCAARAVMVCAKCQHNIYRTFISSCHLRLFNCKHPGETLELISRKPCMQSAPYLANFPEAQGRISEPGDQDRVLKFIHCRDKGKLDDPNCNFDR